MSLEDDTPALGRRDAAKIVDDYLPLIRKLVWQFIKRQGEGVSYDELMPVAYEACREAWVTFNPSLGFVFATHARKRIRYALIDYVGERNRIVKDVELSPERYASAWGDPDAKTKGPLKKKRPEGEFVGYVAGIAVTRYEPGPYRSNPQLIRGLGAVTSRHSKVTVVPTRTQFDDGWHKTSDGTSRKSVRIEDDSNQGVTDPRHVLWAGDKELKGKPKPGPAEYSDWKRIWAANYKKYRCSPEDRMPLVAATLVKPTAPGMTDTSASYVRDDGVDMIKVSSGCYVSLPYLEGKAIEMRSAPAFYGPIIGSEFIDVLFLPDDTWEKEVRQWAHPSSPAKRYDFIGPRRPPLVVDLQDRRNGVSRFRLPDFGAPTLPQTCFVQATDEIFWVDTGRDRDISLKTYVKYIPKYLAAPPKLVDDWRPDPRKQYCEIGQATSDHRWEIRMIGRHVVTGLPVWNKEATPRRIMDRDHFRDHYYDPVQDVPAYGNLVEIKPLNKILSDKHLVPADRETTVRPNLSTYTELRRYANNRWDRNPEGRVISLFLKTSHLGRYNKQEEKISTTVPRPPVLAPALLDGPHSDRRAPSTVAPSEVIEDILQLDILNQSSEATDRLVAQTTTLTQVSDDYGRPA